MRGDDQLPRFPLSALTYTWTMSPNLNAPYSCERDLRMRVSFRLSYKSLCAFRVSGGSYLALASPITEQVKPFANLKNETMSVPNKSIKIGTAWIGSILASLTMLQFDTGGVRWAWLPHGAVQFAFLGPVLWENVVHNVIARKRFLNTSVWNVASAWMSSGDQNCKIQISSKAWTISPILVDVATCPAEKQFDTCMALKRVLLSMEKQSTHTISLKDRSREKIKTGWLGNGVDNALKLKQ